MSRDPVPVLQAFVERAIHPQPLSDDDRAAVLDGVRRCYEESGLDWHGRVTWVPSPKAATPVLAADRPLPVTGRWAGLRRLLEATTDRADTTWERIDRRIRRRWAQPYFRLSEPGTVLTSEHDPLTTVRSAFDAAVNRGDDAPPADRFDGAFDGRLALITLVPSRYHKDGPDPVHDAFVAASGAGPWWPRAHLVVISEPPTGLHVEALGSRPPIVHRLHRDDGPAARWADGFAIHHFHGIEVPADWSTRAAHRHANSEVRRAAIERIGWDRYITEAGWRLVASAPDPGNDPHRLDLYEDPTGRERVRVLVMTNGSPDRSGAPRRYAEAVPEHLADPVAAAAWQYGCPVRVYRRLKRRT